MNPETPATSSARNTRVRNMAYWRTHTKKTVRHGRIRWELFRELNWIFTDQFEHPWAAAARGEAAEQSENNDGGSGPDEDIWRIGALLRRQRQVGLQAHLPPHPDSQQDHACELKKTAGWVSAGIKEPKTEMNRFVRAVCLTQNPRLKAQNHWVNYTLVSVGVKKHFVISESFLIFI